MIQLQDLISDGFGLSSQEWYLGILRIIVYSESSPFLGPLKLSETFRERLYELDKRKSLFGSTWTAYGPSIRDAAMQFFLGTGPFAEAGRVQGSKGSRIQRQSMFDSDLIGPTFMLPSIKGIINHTQLFCSVFGWKQPAIQCP